MYSSTAPEPVRLADEFWLSVHDGGLSHRSTLSTGTRSLGLAGALLVELIDGGLVQVSTGRPGSEHQPLTAGGETILLHPMPGRDRIKDPALEQVYGILVRNGDVAPDSALSDNRPGYRDDRPGYRDDRARYRTDQGGWANTGNGHPPARGDHFGGDHFGGGNGSGGQAGRNPWSDEAPSWRAEPQVPFDQHGYPAHSRHWPTGPAPTPAGHRGSGVPASSIVEFLAIENRAEQLVVNRLLTTGLVRYETRRRLFGADTKVIVPANSVISGRALARITSGLQPLQPHQRRSAGDPNAPRGLNEFDKRMAALFAAAGVFDVDQTGLTGNEMKVLRAELQTGIPASVTAVLRQVSLLVKSFALNR